MNKCYDRKYFYSIFLSYYFSSSQSTLLLTKARYCARRTDFSLIFFDFQNLFYFIFGRLIYYHYLFILIVCHSLYLLLYSFSFKIFLFFFYLSHPSFHPCFFPFFFTFKLFSHFNLHIHSLFSFFHQNFIYPIRLE